MRIDWEGAAFPAGRPVGCLTPFTVPRRDNGTAAVLHPAEKRVSMAATSYPPVGGEQLRVKRGLLCQTDYSRESFIR